MKLSLNWLCDFVDLSNLSPGEVAEALTRSTCEVEGFEQTFTHLNGVVVAEITNRAAHPNADRLSICTVNNGKEDLQIVCGAANADARQVVALATIGSKLPTATDVLEIKPAKIRGVASSGMLCAAAELGLTEMFGESDGLLILGRYTGSTKTSEWQSAYGIGAPKLGAALAEVLQLGDVIFEIDNKSITHRPDLWSHYGFARELALLFGRKLGPDPLAQALTAHGKSGTKKKAGKAASKKTKSKVVAAPAASVGKSTRRTDTGGVSKVVIEAGAAKAYFGAMATGLQVAPAPLWMRARLVNVGQRSINNVVDASNYMLLESGQPNHVFDARRIQSDTVAVIRTKKPTAFTTLDGQERQLPKECVLIQDGAGGQGQALAIAGVMGGLDSAVAADTTEVFLESATFRREDVRRVIARTALRTDSAVRFEKGQNPGNARAGLLRLAELLRKTNPELQLGAVLGSAPEGEQRNRIKLGCKFVNDRLGLDLKPAQMKKTLERLGFDVSLSTGKEVVMDVVVPAYRSQYDITIPEDVVEEIGRIYGYDNIASVAPLFEVKPVTPNQERLLERAIKQDLVRAGFFETNNYSFARLEDNRRLGQDGIALKNPSFQDRTQLRLSLIPGLLRQVASNQDRFEEVMLFELGRIYLPKPGKDTPVTELRRLVAVWLTRGSGSAGGAGVFSGDQPELGDYLHFRDQVGGLLEAQLGRVRPDNAGSDTGASPFVDHLHPACRAVWRDQADNLLGTVGLLHPAWQQDFDLKRRGFVAELYLDQVFAAQQAASTGYMPPSPFPESFFELSVLVDEHASTAQPVTILRGNEDHILRVDLLDVYKGDSLPPAKKSASYRVACGRRDRTLTGDEVQKLMERCVQRLAQADMPLR